jgi:hypothetical protein
MLSASGSFRSTPNLCRRERVRAVEIHEHTLLHESCGVERVAFTALRRTTLNTSSKQTAGTMSRLVAPAITRGRALVRRPYQCRDVHRILDR